MAAVWAAGPESYHCEIVCSPRPCSGPWCPGTRPAYGQALQSALETTLPEALCLVS